MVITPPFACLPPPPKKYIKKYLFSERLLYNAAELAELRLHRDHPLFRLSLVDRPTTCRVKVMVLVLYNNYTGTTNVQVIVVTKMVMIFLWFMVMVTYWYCKWST